MPATLNKKSNPATFEENLLPNGQLRCQIGSRIRLSETDRDALKAAYRAACEDEWSSQNHPSSNPNSTIQVSTKWATPSLTKQLGMDSILFSQIVNSRDPLQLGLLLRIQRALNIEIITYDYLRQVFDSYLDHITKTNQEP